MQEIMNNSKYNVHAIPSFEEGKLILLARGHGYDTWMQQKKQNKCRLLRAKDGYYAYTNINIFPWDLKRT